MTPIYIVLKTDSDDYEAWVEYTIYTPDVVLHIYQRDARNEEEREDLRMGFMSRILMGNTTHGWGATPVDAIENLEFKLGEPADLAKAAIVFDGKTWNLEELP